MLVSRVRLINAQIEIYTTLCDAYLNRIKSIDKERARLIKKAERTVDKRYKLLEQLNNIEEA